MKLLTFLKKIGEDTDSSQAARMARAKALGFDTSQVWYHANTGGIEGEGFDNDRLPASDPDRPFNAHWFSHEPSEFAAYPSTGNTITPVYLKLDKSKEAPHGVWRKLAGQVHRAWDAGDNERNAADMIREKLVSMGYTHAVRGREPIDAEELKRTGETSFMTSTGTKVTLKWEKMNLPPSPPEYTEEEIEIIQALRKAEEKQDMYQTLVIDTVMNQKRGEFSDEQRDELIAKGEGIMDEVKRLKPLADAANERAYEVVNANREQIDSLQMYDSDIGHVTGYSDLADYESMSPEQEDVAVLDPSIIRSVHAQFDPDEDGSNKIMASLGEDVKQDNAARLAQAKAQGFDTDTVWYHGSATAGFDTFSGWRSPVVAAFLTRSTKFASDWADARHTDAIEMGNDEEYGDGGVIYPVFIRVKNIFDIRREDHRRMVGMRDNVIQDYDELEANAQAIQAAGFDSYFDFEGGHDDEVNIAVFDPENIRSINAVFAPNYTDSTHMMASIGESAGVRGPHEGIELELMMQGKKPLAMLELRRETPEKQELWDKLIKAGRIVHQEGQTLSPSKTSTTSRSGRWLTDFLALPDEAWRMNSLQAVYDEVERTGSMSKEQHIDVGNLLGYAPEDIKAFLDPLTPKLPFGIRRVNERHGILGESVEQVYQMMQVTAEVHGWDKFFHDMRKAWVGGIADFGDPQAAINIRHHPEYEGYREALTKAVGEYLGDPFVAYRLMAEDQIEEWQSGADMPAIAVTTELSVAVAFRKLAANRGRDDLRVVQLSVPAEAVIMMGHSGEHELVVDANYISANEVQFLGEASNPDVRVKKLKHGIYAAYLKGRKVGQAQVYDYEDEKVGEDERYIWKSATHPEYTRQGVATELYNVIADDLAAQGLKLVPSPDQQLSGDAYQFWKARDPESIKGHGTYKAETFQHYIGKEIEVRGRPSVVTRVSWVNDAPLIGARFTDVPEGSTNSHATVRFADVADQFNEDEKISLPDLEAGDELMVGKFKNRKATIKGFKKDKNNQPVAKTNKGDQQIFKGRVKKLMDESSSLGEIEDMRMAMYYASVAGDEVKKAMKKEPEYIQPFLDEFLGDYQLGLEDLDDEKRAEFEVWLETAIPDQAADALNRVIQNMKTNDDGIVLYRYVVGPSNLPETFHTRPVGIYWSSNPNDAKAHWSQEEDGWVEWLITGVTSPDNINWVATIFQNTIEPHESEVQVNQGASVTVIDLNPQTSPESAYGKEGMPGQSDVKYHFQHDEDEPLELTASVGNMSESFDRTTTEMPDYDDLIKSIGDEYKTEYFRDQKGKEAKMVDISPDQYLQAVDSGFEHGVMSGIEDEKVQRYAAKLKGGETFPALMLDYSRGKHLSQEGRHRALAAKAVGIDSVPVLVVTPTPEEAEYQGITDPNPELLKTMKPRPLREGPVQIGGPSAPSSGEKEFINDFDAMTTRHPFMPSSRIAMNRERNTGDDFAIIDVQPYGNGKIYLGSIQSSQGGNGNGAAGMKLVTDLADKHGVVLELHVDAFGEAADKLTNRQLKEWYRRVGFVAPEDNKHVADIGRMQRQPR